jgi:alpha-L-fucosidase 2
MLSAFSGTGKAAGCAPVEVRNAEGNYIIPGVLGDIVYRRVGSAELSLDAYVQRKGERRPGVVVIHGGGWTSGSRITYISQLLELLTNAGFNWFSVDYRLAPANKYPAALEDLREALEFIRCNAQAFRIDPTRIALLGDDAGAHLAAMLAAEKPPGVKALLTLGGIFDLRSLERFKATGTDSLWESLFRVQEDRGEQVLADASPVLHPPDRSVAVMAVYGTEDRDVPPDQSSAYCDAIRSVGGRCELLPVPGGIHASENWRPEQWGYKSRIADWLAKELDLKTADFAPHESLLRKNIVYGDYAAASPGKREPLLMDAFIPKGEGVFPAVILAHGGGWEAGDKMTYLTPVLEPLARAGFAWFSIDYRLTPGFRHTEQLEDLRRAIRYVRHNAKRFRVDPDRLAILGESASGQMAAQVAAEPCPGAAVSPDPVDRQPCEIRAAVSFYGVYDFLPMVTDASPRSLLVRLFGIKTLDEEARSVLRRFSPIYHARRDMPPLLLVHGTNERLWEQGQAMARKLAEVGAHHELYALKGAPHGMENWEGHPEWMHYKRKLVEWLKDQNESKK